MVSFDRKKSEFLHQISHQTPNYTKNYTKKSSDNVQKYPKISHEKTGDLKMEKSKKVPDSPQNNEKPGTL